MHPIANPHKMTIAKINTIDMPSEDKKAKTTPDNDKIAPSDMSIPPPNKTTASPIASITKGVLDCINALKKERVKKPLVIIAFKIVKTINMINIGSELQFNIFFIVT